jgi:hypothetical protein
LKFDEIVVRQRDYKILQLEFVFLDLQKLGKLWFEGRYL